MALYSSPVSVSSSLSYSQVDEQGRHGLDITLKLVGTPFDMRGIDRNTFEKGIPESWYAKGLIGRYVLLNYCGVKLEKASRNGIIDPNSRDGQSVNWNDVSLADSSVRVANGEYRDRSQFVETNYVSKIASYNGFPSVEAYKAALPDTSVYYDYKWAINFNRYLWNGSVSEANVDNVVQSIVDGDDMVLGQYTVYRDPIAVIKSQTVVMTVRVNVGDPDNSWTYRLKVGNPANPATQNTTYINYVHRETYYEYEDGTVGSTAGARCPLAYSMANTGKNRITLSIGRTGEFENVNDTIRFKIIKKQTNG